MSAYKAADVLCVTPGDTVLMESGLNDGDQGSKQAHVGGGVQVNRRPLEGLAGESKEGAI